MHIALYSPGWPLEKYQNGIVTFVHLMRLEFERMGHRVSVITSSIDPHCTDPRVHLVSKPRFDRFVSERLRVRASRFGHSNWGELIAAKIKEIHKREPIDIIEMEESFGWFDTVGRVTMIPVLVKLHGPAFLTLTDVQAKSVLGQHRLELEKSSMRNVSALAAPSISALRQTTAKYSLAPRLCEQVRNPLTMDAVTPIWSLRNCERDVVLFIGRFDAAKGGDLVLEAFSVLAAEYPNLRLIFVGSDVGVVRTNGERLGFVDYCRENLTPETQKRIVFKGPLPQRELATLRVGAMVTVLPSRWENQSYAVLEAMYQGCPIVCSDSGGNPELIQDGINGLLAVSGDAASLAKRISDVLKNPAGAEKMGAAASTFVRKEHALHSIAANSIELYRRVIQNHALVDQNRASP